MDSEQQLLQVLRFATDKDFEVVRKAEEQLRAWEQSPRFFVALARLCFSNVGSVDVGGGDSMSEKPDINARWMAASYLKNAVNKFWRHLDRKFVLPNTEKEEIRSVLLYNFAGEPVRQVVVQVAEIIGTIARIDFPQDWPELLPFLLERLGKHVENNKNLRGSELAEQQRLLLVQLHVIKALASRRRIAHKLSFEDLTNDIFPFVQRLWKDFTTMFFQELHNPNEALETLTCAHLSLRMLRKMCVFGYTERHKFDCGFSFFEQLFAGVEECLQCRYGLLQQSTQEMPFMSLLERFIVKQMKILNDFHDMHAEAFARFLPTSLEFGFQHVFHERAPLIFTDSEINFPDFAIQCITLMTGVMMNSQCASMTPENDSFPFTLGDFFTKERVSYICEKLLTHYFVLTRGELQKWDDDPEAFDQDADEEWYRYALRPCVEHFYLNCFKNSQTSMVSDVVKFVEKAQQVTLTPDSDLKDILLKDAIYNAVGIAAFHFGNDVDFNAWFSAQLLAELRIESNNFRILRRRILLLISDFTAVKFSCELRPLAYEACLHLLRPEEDMSVRLAASVTLETLIDDVEFAAMPFLPYLELAFNSLYFLLANAKECQTKITVLFSMSTLVKTMSNYIEPVAEKFIAYLALLWKESEEYQMLRCSVISTLQQIVRAVHDVPDSMKPFLCEVIQFSVDVEQPAHNYLIEDGLALWVAVVENSPSLTPALEVLCKQIEAVMDMGAEYLRAIFVLVQGYILLDAHGYLELYGRKFVDFCLSSLGDMRSEEIVYMMRVLETCLKAEPRDALELVRPVLQEIFKKVYKDESSLVSVLSMNLMMLARTVLIDSVVFTETVQSLQLPNAMERIFDIWIAKMPFVGDLDKKKLYSLALASVLPSNNHILHERFAGIIQNIGETLFDIMEEEAEEHDSNEEEQNSQAKKFTDTLVYMEWQDFDANGFCTMDDCLQDSHHYDRCRQLTLKDPVHQIDLNEFLKNQLESMHGHLGDEAYKRLWERVPVQFRTDMSCFFKVPL